MVYFNLSLLTKKLMNTNFVPSFFFILRFNWHKNGKINALFNHPPPPPAIHIYTHFVFFSFLNIDSLSLAYNGSALQFFDYTMVQK